MQSHADAKHHKQKKVVPLHTCPNAYFRMNNPEKLYIYAIVYTDLCLSEQSETNKQCETNTPLTGFKV